MRAIGLSDLDVTTRALLAEPQCNWAHSARVLIEGAHACDLWRKRFGNTHPDGGTGSLYAQAALRPSVARTHCDTQYCAALAVLLAALATWRRRDHIET